MQQAVSKGKWFRKIAPLLKNKIRGLGISIEFILVKPVGEAARVRCAVISHSQTDKYDPMYPFIPKRKIFVHADLDLRAQAPTNCSHLKVETPPTG
jgi:hypothetical protein